MAPTDTSGSGAAERAFGVAHAVLALEQPSTPVITSVRRRAGYNQSQ